MLAAKLGLLRERFGTLSWKLALSYVGVTMLVILALETVVLLGLGYLVLSTNRVPAAVAESTRFLASELQPAFAARDRSPERLARALKPYIAGTLDADTINFRADFGTSLPAEQATPADDSVPAWSTSVVVLLDDRGQVLASTLPAQYPIGVPLVALEPEAAGPVLDRARRGRDGAADLATHGAQRQAIGAAPVRDSTGKLLGIVYMRDPATSPARFFAGLPMMLLATGLPVLIFSALMGLVFGSFAGRRFSRRLRRLAAASAAFAAGDLSQRVADGSPDEVGQLARQFNVMAGQIADNLRELRQLAEHNALLAEQATQLAAVEERNRLARDLHDSVSQELFSISLQASAGRRLTDGLPVHVAAQFDEIKETARHALQETRSLIFALRPAALEGRGLAAALEDLVCTVEERQGLQITLSINGAAQLPLEQEQALFRIVQEALGNVARHSGVHAASVDLTYGSNETRLTVADRGHGFDPATPRRAQSLGLRSMAERVASLGGTYAVHSAPGEGTIVAVVLPAASSTTKEIEHGKQAHTRALG